MKCLGRFKIQALTHCDANVMSTRTTAGQFKCEFKGAMECYKWVRFAGKSHRTLPQHTANSEHTQ